MSTPAEDLAIHNLDGVQLWRMSIEKYHELGWSGAPGDERIELLEGLLVRKQRKTPRHSVATSLLEYAFRELLSTGWHAWTHCAITLERSEPEPDVAIVRGEIRDFSKHHPYADSIAVVVEIADSTLKQDRGLKKRIYARAGIPLYWLVNLIDNQIEVYSDPSGPTQLPDYHQRRDYQIDDALPVVIGGDEIGSLAVRDLLP